MMEKGEAYWDPFLISVGQTEDPPAPYKPSIPFLTCLHAVRAIPLEPKKHLSPK